MELLIAYDGQWRPAGRWTYADTSWPAQVAPAAATLMRLHTDLAEATPPAPPLAARQPPHPAAADAGAGGSASAHAATPAGRPPTGRPGGRGSRIMLVQLLEAGLLQPGERLYWPRANTGELHKATITAAGHVRLADGSRHATPSAALTALGSPNTSGWTRWRLARDDQPLDTLRQRYIADTAPAATHP